MKSPMHSVGKPLLWTTFLLALVITQITTVKATPGTTIRIEPYASSAQVGESFTINITLTDVQNLYGVDVILHWNASILQVVGVDVRLGVESHPDGVLHEPIFIAKNETIQEEGKYWLAGTSTSPADPFSGSGNIVRITFNVTNIGSCELDLETELADWPPPDRDPRISWPIKHTTIDGFFVIPEFPQIIILPLFIVLTMLAVVFTKKRLPRNKKRAYHRNSLACGQKILFARRDLNRYAG